MNVRVPQKAKNSLKTYVTVSCSIAVSYAVCYAGDENCVVSFVVCLLSKPRTSFRQLALVPSSGRTTKIIKTFCEVRYMQLAFIFGDSQVLSLPSQKYALKQVITVSVWKTLSSAQAPRHHSAAGNKGRNPSWTCGWDAGHRTLDAGRWTPEALHYFNVPYHTIFSLFFRPNLISIDERRNVTVHCKFRIEWH